MQKLPFCDKLSLFVAISFSLFAWAILMIRKSFNIDQQIHTKSSMISFIFMGLDAVLLAALPFFKISFGTIILPLAAFAIFRLTLLLFWLVFWKILHISSKLSLPSQKNTCLFLLSGIHLCLTLCLVYGFYFEPHNLKITHINLPASATPTEQSMRIVHLSDLHIERTTSREILVIEQVTALSPDIIFLTGDYLNTSYLDDPITMKDTRNLLSQLSAPYGIYAINGNVDSFETMQKIFNGLNITVLNDELIPISTPQGTVTLLGVSTISSARDKLVLRNLAAQIPTNTPYTILLAHRPDMIGVAQEFPIDLYLSGHTHGGQVRLPFYGAIVTFSSYAKAYERGLYQVNQTDLYVSRGLGMKGNLFPRVRFLCPPEIVSIDLSLQE